MADQSRWTLTWGQRPAEEARIFNPAFCGEIIARAVGEYYRTAQGPFSIASAFLVLPLTLHAPTREALPGRANTAFAGWVAEHAALLAELPDRTRRLRPVSREALLFALLHQLLALEEGGVIPGAKPVRPNARPAVSTDEVKAIRSTAGLLGRWFGGQAAQSSVLQGMGLAP